MRVAIYPGTFDPFTLGHRAMLVRAEALFDRVVVGVASSARKAPFLSLSERLSLVRETCQDLKYVQVEPLEKLLVDFAKQHQARFVLRGLRSSADYSYEAEMAEINRQLFSALETVFLSAEPKFSAISSTMVREIYQLGGDISAFVPKNVWQYLQDKPRHGA